MATTRSLPTKFSAIFQWHSLKARVPLFTLGIFLISIWSLALYASYILQKDMGQALGEQQFSTVSIIASDIDDELAERLKTLEIIAAKITPNILGNAASTQKLLESQLSALRLFNFGATVIKLDGIAIADVPISAGRIGFNYSDRDWVIELFKKKKSLIGNPAWGKKSKAPVFVMTAPIQDANGKMIGAILGVTDLGRPNFLSKITDNSYGKTGGYLLVAPKSRTIVCATDKKRIMEVLPAIGINPFIDRAIRGWEGSGIAYTPFGMEVLTSIKGIPVSGWYLALLMPTEEVFAPIHAMLWSVLLVTIFLSMLAGGLIWWMLKHQLVHVFTTIKTLAKLSGTDQTPQPLPITRQDEIGELIGGFNHLLKILGQREGALRESETHYRSLVESMPCIVYAFSQKRGGVYYSSKVTHLLGYSPEQLYAQPLLWHNSIHPDDLSCIEEVIRETATGKPFCVEYRIRDAHGNWHWFDDRSFGYKKVEGADTIIEGFAFDITDRKQAESKQENMEKQLLQAQKMEAIGTLAGGVAHDFNNILSVIIGYTELAMDRKQKENQIQYLQETLKGAERAKNLVKQILTFSRQDDHEKKPLDIKILLKEAVKFLRASIPTTIEINQQITEEPCNIMADPTQMHQIIMNLCTNAVHAMKQTGGILKIELANIDLAKGDLLNNPDLQPWSYVKLTVSDTGHGIDPELIHRVFDPFFTTKSKDEGTGLGLSVVYGIVKSHGGVINVYSELEQGTAFSVYLPRIIHTETMKVDMNKPIVGGTERILFVDDEPELVDMGIRILFSLGYYVAGAASSIDAHRC